MVGPPSVGQPDAWLSPFAFWGDWHQYGRVGRSVRLLLSVGACPGCGQGCLPVAACGPAHRALGQVHPCCSPSVLGHRGCSMALCPSWGSPHCCCWEKGQIQIKDSSTVPLSPSPALHPDSLSLLVCPSHRPGGPWFQASAFLYQACLAGAVLLRACYGQAPWEPSSWLFGRQVESCSSHPQDPAALNKATPSGALGAGPLFCVCF